MICPKGEPVHENLSSEYTDVSQLLSTLRIDRFSGIVEVRSPGKRGLFFVSLGETIDAIAGSDADPTAMVGEEAIEELLVTCARPNAVLGVYKLTVDEVEFVVSTIQSEIIFKGLSTEYVRLDRFLRTLADEKHNGFIEVFSRENRTIGVIVIKNGDAQNVVSMSKGAEPVFLGPEGIPRFIDDIARQSLLFNVNRTTPVASTSEAPSEKPAVNPPAEKTDRVTAEPASMAAQKAPEVASPDQISRCGPSARELQTDEAKLDSNEKRTKLLLDTQNILVKMERFVGGLTEKGSFQRAFKRACVEKSDIYPFLDPFDGLFDYSDGHLQLDDGIATEAFSAGAAECIDLTLAYLQRELPKKTVLPVGLKGDIENSFGQYQQELAEFGAQRATPVCAA